jgi:hypothetical protein
MTADIEIIGDPYYIADSGMGNFSDVPVNFNENANGSMNYQSGEVDVIVNFRTPTDYNSVTGQMDFMSGVQNAGFSGLYNVQEVTNMFKGGKFTQTLKAIRRPIQEPLKEEISREKAREEALKKLDTPTSGSSPIRDETGKISNIRRNEETGELYDGSGLYNDDGNTLTQKPGQASKKSLDSVSKGSRESQVEYTNTGIPVPGRPRGGA